MTAGPLPRRRTFCPSVGLNKAIGAGADGRQSECSLLLLASAANLLSQRHRSRAITGILMSQLIVRAGDFTFQARFEEQLAPKTCAAFRQAMPFESQAIHVRWSGEGVWMPLGDLDFGVSYENHTSYPAPGQIILYPGGISETEILLAYGGVHFASKMGQLAGNHFITLTSGLERLPELGKNVLRSGAQTVRFEAA